MKRIFILFFIVMSGVTMYSQNNEKKTVQKTVIAPSKKVIVKQESAFQYRVQKTDTTFSDSLTDMELLVINETICNILIKNHFDKEGILAITSEFKAWMASYYGKMPLVSEICVDITSWLRKRTKDKHFIFKEVGAQNAGAVSLEGWYMGKYNFGVKKLEWFPNNSAYLDYRGFNPEQLSQSKYTLINALKFLNNAKNVIIDLRNNYGGDAAMAQFLLGTIIGNDSTALWVWEDRYNEEFFSSIQYSLVDSSGLNLQNKNIYVLQGNKTGSAAELFCYFCKKNNLATLVGSKTSGGTHTMATFSVAGRFTFGIPNGRMLDISTKEDIQLKGGINPHINIDEDEALEYVKLNLCK